MKGEVEIIGPNDLPRIEELEAQNKALYTALRSLDEKIWLMSQCEGWDTMRPHFQAALTETNSRKNKEHARITELLVPELKKVYL